MDRQRIILSLYRTAADPSHYETMVDEWSSSIAGQLAWTEHEQELEPHLAIAETLVQDLTEVQVLSSRSDQPVLLCDKQAVVRELNMSAEHLGVALGDSLHRINLPDGASKNLQQLISRLLADNADIDTAFMHTPGDDGAPWVISIQKIKYREEQVVRLRFSNSKWHKVQRKSVAEALNLTAREADIVEALFAGDRIKKLGDRFGISEATVRTHINAIHRKNGINSQMQLMALVSQIIDLSDSCQDETDLPSGWRAGVSADPLLRVALSDGSNIEYFRRGQSNKNVVVYLHGNVIGYRLSPELEKSLAQRGITLICIIRPGYGASDSVDSQGDWLAQGAARIAELIEKLNLQDVALVGKDAGSLFALAAAEQLGERVSQVCLVAMPIPLLKPSPNEGINKWGRAVIQSACLHPVALRYFMRAGFEYARRIGPEKFFRKIFYNSPVDLKVADDKQAMLHQLLGSRPIIRGGFEPSSRDTLLSVSDWTPLLERAQHRVTAIHGELDIFWDIEEIVQLLSRFPNVRLRRCEGAGHLPLSAEPAALLELLDK